MPKKVSAATKQKPVTISVIKADIGGYVGHSASHPDILDLAEKHLDKAMAAGTIEDFHVSACGDDLELVMTHWQGNDSKTIHGLAWDVFSKGTELAKKLKLHGAGQDMLADSFCGNVKGMGPGVAEKTLIERSSEPVVIFWGDKCAPGAWNYPLYRMFADPSSTIGLVIDPSVHDGFRFEVPEVHQGYVYSSPDGSGCTTYWSSSRLPGTRSRMSTHTATRSPLRTRSKTGPGRGPKSIRSRTDGPAPVIASRTVDAKGDGHVTSVDVHVHAPRTSCPSATWIDGVQVTVMVRSPSAASLTPRLPTRPSTDARLSNPMKFLRIFRQLSFLNLALRIVAGIVYIALVLLRRL